MIVKADKALRDAIGFLDETKRVHLIPLMNEGHLTPELVKQAIDQVIVDLKDTIEKLERTP